MTQERDPKPAQESTAAATSTRQRKKRKWDQPAESLMSAGISVAGTFPLSMCGIVGVPLPETVRLPSPVISNSVAANSATVSLLLQSSFISQNSDATIQQISQPKIPDELIAREIVINDAEPTIRYKLTKRQTQEEIQRYTGAVVITRGKYQPPNVLPGSEKPLYLHISAGAHLTHTAERIKAVDRAASMIEDILKQGQNSLPGTTALHSTVSNGQATQPLSACLYLGFETDPSLNIAARIRGPNDNYINHIMNETGATVVLRGRRSGNEENFGTEEEQQPLHLYLSSTNPKSLEAARNLAENLLDTISAECGASRISSCKVNSAVLPPKQLLSGVQSSVDVLNVNANPVASLPFTTAGYTPSPAPNGSTGSDVCLPGTSIHSGGLSNYGNPSLQVVSYTYPSVSGGTYYSGYGGIYPQATPLQQVALALRKAPAQTTPGLASTACATITASAEFVSSNMASSSSAEIEKRRQQRRKFQETPVVSNETATSCQNFLQASECLKPGLKDSNSRNISSMPPPKKLIHKDSDGMPPAPPRTMPPPPPKFDALRSPSPSPPPKFAPHKSASHIEKSQEPGTKKPNDGPVSDTLLKLVDYGEDDDDDDIDVLSVENFRSNVVQKSSSKPFWAV